MFGKSEDKEIVEIVTGTLKVHYYSPVTRKRKETNEYTKHDNFMAIFSDASEEEFKRIVDEVYAEMGGLTSHRDIENRLSKN